MGPATTDVRALLGGAAFSFLTPALTLAVALCMRPEFEEKVKTVRLLAANFVLIECRYNDPR